MRVHAHAVVKERVAMHRACLCLTCPLKRGAVEAKRVCALIARGPVTGRVAKAPAATRTPVRELDGITCCFPDPQLRHLDACRHATSAHSHYGRRVCGERTMRGHAPPMRTLEPNNMPACVVWFPPTLLAPPYIVLRNGPFSHSNTLFTVLVSANDCSLSL